MDVLYLRSLTDIPALQAAMMRAPDTTTNRDASTGQRQGAMRQNAGAFICLIPSVGAGAATLATLAVAGLTPHGVQHAALAGVLTAAALTDGQRGIVPNGLVAIALLCALGIRGVQGTPLVEMLFPGCAVFGVLLAVREGSRLIIGRIGLGMGDVKLGLVLGLFLGWPAFWALYLAAVLCALFGGLGLVAGVLDRRTRLPFAPFVALGTLLHVLVPFPL